MDVFTYKCPCCDAALVYDGKGNQLKCEYCDTEFEMETIRANYEAEAKNNGINSEEIDNWEQFDAGNKNEWDADESAELAACTCPACGGEIYRDVNTAATHCPYCGNPTLLTEKLSGVYKPDYVIPFKISKEEAKTALQNFCKGKPLLPKFFIKENRIDNITGIYVPFWIYSCDTDASITYHATKVHHWSDSRYHYTKTDHFTLIRDGSIKFERIPVDGSSKMDDAYMEAIEPYDYSGMVPFEKAYLPGYLADKYDVASEDCRPRIKERINQTVNNEFQKTTVGYSNVMPKNKNIRITDGNVHYALFPVWLLNTKWKDKIYTFAMNGQTGKFVGNLPVSKGRYAAWLFGITGILAAIASLVCSFM